MGQIIKIRENEYFPCDILLLNTSLPKGICYIETKNLDGETNLKHKQADKKMLALSKNNEEMLANFNNAKIESETPNASIYTYQGVMKLAGGKEIALEADNICLRGSSLRNTEWIIGIAVFTGHDTKVMMNSAKSLPKFSKIEKITQKYIVVSIIIQMVLCLAFALATSIWNKSYISGGVNCDQLINVDTTEPFSWRMSGEAGDRKITPCYTMNERENIHAYWYLGLDMEKLTDEFDLYDQNTFV